MGFLRNIADGLTNALTGLGTSSDPRRANAYAFCPLSQHQIESAYRGSGLMRKVIDIPAFDMVREWRDWQAEADQITALEAEERRLGIQQKILLAEVLRGLGGGALILGAPGEPAMPLSKAIGKGALQYIHVVNRWQLRLGDMVDDPTGPAIRRSPLFRGQHGAGPAADPSEPRRLLQGRPAAQPHRHEPGGPVLGREPGAARARRRPEQRYVASGLCSADLEGAEYHCRHSRADRPRVDGARRTGARQAARGHAARGIDLQRHVRDAGDGSPGAGETIDHRQVNWAGIPEIVRVFAEAVSAVSDIPMTRLWGRSADGMNASGESQQKDYNKHVRAKQTLMLRPCLDQLDAALIPSALGSRPAEVWWQFAPLDTPTEAEEATRFKTTMEAVEKVQNTGAIPEEAFAKGLQSTLIEGGWMPGLEGALAEIPEGERYGLNAEAEEDDPSALTQTEPDPSKIGDAAARALTAKGIAKGDFVEFDSDQQSEKGPSGGKVIKVRGNRVTIAHSDDPGEEFDIDQLRVKSIGTHRNGGVLWTFDAAPKTLYVERKLLNADEVIRWAKEQGLETTLAADDMHVTVAFSRSPVDWFAVGSDWSGDENGRLRVKPGGPRTVERLGDGDAVALLFSDDSLEWRHKRIREAGASWDWPDYRPHVTLSWNAPGVDVSKIEPYTGPLVFGPELFSEVKEDWAKGVVEK